jgi:hypothetical protein
MKVSEFRYRQRVGKRPAGRGNWAFMVCGQRVAFVDELYSVAKKAAVKVAEERGSRGIRLIAPSHEELAAVAVEQLEVKAA